MKSFEHLNFIQFLQQLNETGTRWALLNESGETLAMRPSLPTDLSSLRKAATEVDRILSLKDGDIAITNSTVVTQSNELDFALVQKISFPHLTKPLLFIELVALESFAELFKEAKPLVPVPPLHLFRNGADHSDILESMSPFFGPHFSSTMREVLDHHLLVRMRLEEFSKWFPEFFKNKFLATFFARTHEALFLQLEDIRIGEKKWTVDQKDFGHFSLHLEKHESHFFADFSRSQLNHHVLPSDFEDAALAALLLLTSFEIPINEGLLHSVKVKAPRSVASYARRSYAQLQTVPILCELVFKTFSQLHMRPIGAMNALGSFTLQMQFDDQTIKRVFLGGGGALDQVHGTMGRCPWLKDFSILSLEGLEAEAPLFVKSVGPVKQSGGRGIRNGGEGISWNFKWNKPVTVHYASPQLQWRAEGESGGKAGQPSHIKSSEPEESALENLEIEKEDRDLPIEGTFKFSAGETFHFSTAGGGGFGSLSQEKT